MLTPLSKRSDETLMKLFSRGREEAYEVLFRRHFPRLTHFFFRSSGDRETSKDLAQEVLLKVFRSGDSYREKARFTTWLYTIARNTYLNHVRDRKKDKRVADYMVGDNTVFEHSLKTRKSSAHDPIESVSAKELNEKIGSVLKSLPESLRTPFLMAQLSGLSYSEIAGILEITTGAVKLRIFRAREIIHEELKKSFDETDSPIPG